MKNKQTPINIKYDSLAQETLKKVPIYKGCKNLQCYCTGSCREIIGYRDKLPNEN